ncbi:MAG: DNA gyrase inhibitor YacG [Gammaproteobacteria bacterium]|nr:DNA gyrase inhibitor YacG [Gammaproteobacteria bacterium]
MPANKQPIKIVKCPTCGVAVKWTEKNPWRPFCRKRCRLIDLGAWADESHRITSNTSPDFTDDDKNFT